MTDAVAPPPDAPKPPWRNPFIVAFVLGVVFLTALPLLQRRFLTATPPVRDLGPWELSTLDGGTVSAASLKGHVYMTSFVPNVCDEACVTRFESFGHGLEHTDDLGDTIHLVSLVQPGALARTANAKPGPRWHVGIGSVEAQAALLRTLRAGWAEWAHTDAGTTDDEFAAVAAIGVVDQNGALRAFWKDDYAGRGNAINAARLLAKYGPQP